MKSPEREVFEQIAKILVKVNSEISAIMNTRQKEEFRKEFLELLEKIEKVD